MQAANICEWCMLEEEGISDSRTAADVVFYYVCYTSCVQFLLCLAGDLATRALR